MTKTWYRLISSEKPSLAAAAALLPLRLLGSLYGAIVSKRNSLYDSGRLETARLNKPVISVGNITAGGTGKTPIVIELCETFEPADLRIAVLTRGYAAKDGFADEPEEIRLSCPGARVYVNPDRVKGAEEAQADFEPQLYILDDGFQHRRVARDLNILAIDASNPFGGCRMLPAGLLREPLSGIKRADICFITKSEMATPQRLEEIEAKIRAVKDMPIVHWTQKPQQAVMLDGSAIELPQLKGKKAFAFCGIGNPDSFFSSLKNAGVELVETKAFPDHHSYNPQEVKQMLYKTGDVDIILMTRKDFVKVCRFSNDAEIAALAGKIGCLKIGLEITKNDSAWSDALEKIGELIF